MDDPRSKADRDLDEMIEESFPASDAPGRTGETGIRTGDAPPDDATPLDDDSTNPPTDLP